MGWVSETVTGVVALAGIAGTLTGTFFAPTWVDKRVQRRREHREFRRARRLVAHELEFVAVQLEAMAEDARQVEVPERSDHLFLPTRDWNEERSVLATELGDERWAELRQVYARIVTLRDVITTDVHEGEPEHADEVEMMESVAREAQTAARWLATAEAEV